MSFKLLLTSTSFMDTPGKHQELLEAQGFEIDRLRGPVNEAVLLPIIGNYDAVICGDDDYTAAVLETGKKGRLKFISKYGVGLDRIDQVAAKKLNIPVTNCPGVNQVSVAEHAFALLLTFVKNIHLEYNITRRGEWKRYTSREIYGKTIGIIGLGAIGKELVPRAKAFGLEVIGFDKFVNQEFVAQHKLSIVSSVEELAERSDIISLHVPLTEETTGLISMDLVQHHLKPGVIIINTARGKLVDLDALKYGLDQQIIGGYLADVLDIEPIPADYAMKDWNNVLITPHISSRSFESVERQGTFAVRNLLELIK